MACPIHGHARDYMDLEIRRVRIQLGWRRKSEIRLVWETEQGELWQKDQYALTRVRVETAPVLAEYRMLEKPDSTFRPSHFTLQL